MLIRSVLVAAALSLAPAAWAQSAADHIALGDREYAAAHAPAALQHYAAAVAADPTNYEALWKASREAIDAGENETDDDRRTALFRKGEQYARRAVTVKPADAEGHFHLARSLGKAALASGPRDQIKYGTEVRAQALEALKYDPNHPGALHVMGMWNAQVMRLNGATRWIAKNVLGGQVFGSASWKNAVDYMEKSVAVDPNRVIHHLDLAGVYIDVDQKAKARAQLQAALRLTPTEPNEDRYQRQARELLQKIS
jgi:tetratricopeptide (TPR) repeat protein